MSQCLSVVLPITDNPPIKCAIFLLGMGITVPSTELRTTSKV